MILDWRQFPLTLILITLTEVTLAASFRFFRPPIAADAALMRAVFVAVIPIGTVVWAIGGVLTKPNIIIPAALLQDRIAAVVFEQRLSLRARVLQALGALEAAFAGTALYLIDASQAGTMKVSVDVVFAAYSTVALSAMLLLGMSFVVITRTLYISVKIEELAPQTVEECIVAIRAISIMAGPLTRLACYELASNVEQLRGNLRQTRTCINRIRFDLRGTANTPN